MILTLSHPLDYLRWLFGDVESLWCFSGHLSDLENDVEDCAEIGLRYTNGILGSLHLDYCQRPPVHHKFERQQRYERDMAGRVVALLEPVVGADRVRVNVAVRMSADSEDRIEEQWDPNTVVRSRAVTQETGGGAASGGVAGARANVPGPVPPGATQPAAPAVATALPGAGAAPGRSTETTAPSRGDGAWARPTIEPGRTPSQSA